MFHPFGRMLMVGAVKWVDEVIPDAPYAITEEFMNKLFTEYNIDYIIHGDDPCLLPDGTDAYALAKKAGRYKQIKRTEGVSSTDIVGSHPALALAFLCLCPNARIVYIDGAFDLFHAGHVEVCLASSKGYFVKILYYGLLENLEIFYLLEFTLIKQLVIKWWQLYIMQKRNEKKEASEKRYYETKTYVSGD
ncbi:hypothetical protein BHE74_00039401 [Ensete ventricosum]|nr:hypothetical protein GW17_00022486 [Ensete ventricosum]RWW54045.1 hypothetical protein BHE74_00039401 [Ensete ventricosum]